MPWVTIHSRIAARAVRTDQAVVEEGNVRAHLLEHPDHLVTGHRDAQDTTSMPSTCRRLRASTSANSRKLTATITPIAPSGFSVLTGEALLDFGAFGVATGDDVMC